MGRVRRQPIGAVIAAGFFVGSMMAYPGGTVWNPQSSGYDVLRNYLCDLLGPQSLNGAPNALGATLGIAGFVVAIVGLLIPLWVSLPRLIPGPRWPRYVRRAGLSAVAIFFMLPLALWTHVNLVHHLVVFGAGTLGFGAAILMTVQLHRSSQVPTWVSAVGASALLISVVDIVIYAVQLTAHHEPAVLGPSLQKVALVLILIWLPAVGVYLSARP